MDSIYDKDIFAPIQNPLECYDKHFILSPELWAKFDISDLVSVDFSKWESIKLIENGKFSKKYQKFPMKLAVFMFTALNPT